MASPHASRCSDAVKRAQTFRIYPTAHQQVELRRMIDDCRAFYNEIVAYSKERHRAVRSATRWDFSASSLSAMSLSYAATEARKTDRYADSVSVALRGAVTEFDLAVKLCKAKRKRGEAASMPGFRSAKRGPWSFRYVKQTSGGPSALSDMTRNTERRIAEIRLLNVGWVRARLHRQLDDILVGFVIVKVDAFGRWWVTIQYDIVLPQRTPTGVAIGVDRGVKHTLVTDDGRAFSMPQLGTKQQRRLEKLQRKLAWMRQCMPCPTMTFAVINGRVKKTSPCACAPPAPGEAPACWNHSKRYQGVRLQIAALLDHQSRIRHDASHKVTRALADEADVVAMEDLAVRSMMASAKGTEENPGRNVAAKTGLNRSIAAQGWYSIESKLAYKTSVVKVPAAYTSQTCPECGHVDAANRRSRDVFVCIACGFLEHADVVGARNILARAAYNFPVPVGQPAAGAQSVDGRPELPQQGSRNGAAEAPSTTTLSPIERPDAGPLAEKRSHPGQESDLAETHDEELHVA